MVLKLFVQAAGKFQWEYVRIENSFDEIKQINCYLNEYRTSKLSRAN